MAATQRWGASASQALALGERHRWTYRGQVLPHDEEVVVQAEITAVDEASRSLRADGLLQIDGRVIYQMQDFTLRCGP